MAARGITGLDGGTLMMVGAAASKRMPGTVAIQRAHLSNMRHTGVMTGPTSFAIILTHNRPVELAATLRAVSAQGVAALVIDNASDPPVKLPPPAPGMPVWVLHNNQQPPNLSALWNRGLDWIGSWFGDDDRWNVALLCDDVVLPPDWFESVRTTMRGHGASAASRHQMTNISSPILKTEPDRDLANRMCGWAFMVAGERGLRADERLHWWWCDTHMDFLARKNGGMVIAPGEPARNGAANYWTTRRPELAEQAGRDGDTFAEIWAHDGGRPW